MIESDAQLGGILDRDTDPAIKRKAQLAVCSVAEDSAEALELMRMLGLIGVTDIPDRPEPEGDCARCGEPCVTVPPGRGIPAGMRAYAKHGICRPCYRGAGVTRA
ncbi:hypothetical protein CH267_00795 [Rhodococcus sp. 06-621-2]|nr:hypothetical protein [Rhodococcus sp. 06-621-2]OZC62112.1 hypothetical protein CH267_00795 [Rhodococcus sp. 06-621-2]